MAFFHAKRNMDVDIHSICKFYYNKSPNLKQTSSMLRDNAQLLRAIAGSNFRFAIFQPKQILKHAFEGWQTEHFSFNPEISIAPAGSQSRHFLNFSAAL